MLYIELNQFTHTLPPQALDKSDVWARFGWEAVAHVSSMSSIVLIPGTESGSPQGSPLLTIPIPLLVMGAGTGGEDVVRSQQPAKEAPKSKRFKRAEALCISTSQAAPTTQTSRRVGSQQVSPAGKAYYCRLKQGLSALMCSKRRLQVILGFQSPSCARVKKEPFSCS